MNVKIEIVQILQHVAIKVHNPVMLCQAKQHLKQSIKTIFRTISEFKNKHHYKYRNKESYRLT